MMVLVLTMRLLIQTGLIFKPPRQLGRWVVTTNEPQAFHIEGVRFKVLNRNGKPTPPEDYGWKDTVWVDSRVEISSNDATVL